MYSDIKNKLEAFYKFGESLDEKLNLTANLEVTIRDILRNEYIFFLIRLAGAENSVSFEATEYINAIFETDFSSAGLDEFLSETEDNNFLNRVPLGLRIFVDFDNILLSKSEPSDDINTSASSILLSLYDELGNNFIDEAISQKFFVRAKHKQFISMIKNFVNNELITRPQTPKTHSSNQASNEASATKETQSQNQIPIDDEVETIESLLKHLNEMVGLEAVKADVNSIINLLKIGKIREQRGLALPPMSKHLVFSGNPGTGKTTVARLLGKIYYHLGVLSKGHLVEVDRSGLVGGFVGQTALKVNEVVEKALGGILFVDEAYSLTVKKHESDYGFEAVDVLLKAMEDHRDDLIVIVAGYPDLMDEFLQSNPGLKSRFNKFIHFADYTADELLQIFESFCQKSGYKPSEGCLYCAYAYFKSKAMSQGKNFANARTVRNFFEKAITNQANRLASDPNITDDELCELLLDDVKSIP